MIANTAFLAALTVFLLAAWMAGELRFLAPYKAVLFREQRPCIVGAALIRLPEPMRPFTASRAGCSCGTPAAS